MKISKTTKNVATAAILGLLASAAMANQGVQDSDAFYSFYKTVTDWTGGALGVGAATTMLLMGGLIGVAKNSPMPALSGVGGAAILHWGPQIIQSIMTTGAVV